MIFISKYKKINVSNDLEINIFKLFYNSLEINISKLL